MQNRNRDKSRPSAMKILPSATTVLAICAGLTSIKFALDDRPHIALALIGAAAILDGIDGGIARALDAQSRMGAEIDSLADAVNFGVAPALVVYVTVLPHSPVGWIFALLYCVCIILRLARFNALLDDNTKPAYTRQYFTGMPAPCGAVGVIGPLAALLQFGEGWWSSHWFICVWFAANAALLVSRVPTLALKSVSMPTNAAPILLIAIAAAATRISRMGAAFSGTEMAFSASVGTRLTSRAALAASHAQTNQCDVHQPWPNCIMATIGPIAPTAPHGAGMPVKNSRV